MRLAAATLVAMLGLAGCAGDAPPGPVVLSITVTAPKQTIAVGESVQLTATARDVNGVTVPGVRFTYASSVGTVASVDASGTVLGLAAGATAITAASANRTSPPLEIVVTGSSSMVRP